MKRFSPKQPKTATGPRLTTWVHASDAIAGTLDRLLAEAEQHIEFLGGFHGPVRPQQRPWSLAIDQIDAEREVVT